MRFQRKILVVAMACALPWMSANAQSAADLKKEIETLKAQLQMLTQKVEAMGSPAGNVELVQQVNRIEQRQDLASDVAEKSGLKDMFFKGTISAQYSTDNLSGIHQFRATDGNDVTALGLNAVGTGGIAMFEITKHHDGGDAIDWTLRLTPKSWAGDVNEASISIPLNDDGSHRLIGGLIPDWTGYEYFWANQNPLITHNAIYDYLSATSYQGIGMSHQLYNVAGQTVALKWLVGNIDSASYDTATNANGDAIRSVGAAYRFDWTLSEYASLGLAGNFGNGSRNWQIHEVDGGFIRGDWLFNGMLTYGKLNGAGTDWTVPAANGLDASWWAVSGLVGYKTSPRLQLLARADYVQNKANGGGTYGGGSALTSGTAPAPYYNVGLTASGFGADANGVDGASLIRISLGTNYQINQNAQWKLEYRLDKSSGNNFQTGDGDLKDTKNTLATALVFAF